MPRCRNNVGSVPPRPARFAVWCLSAATIGVAAPSNAGSSASCPAGGGGGPGCAGGAKTSEQFCVAWRQTGGCNPNGPREKNGDKRCNEEIPTGSSGYCQCGTGSQKLRAREATCDHRPFVCETECLQVHRYTCVGWRHTGGCSADGDREPNNDKSCDDVINARMSGYCECGDGRIVRRPGCEHGEFEEPFTCRSVCAHEPDLYEELGLDKGASDKAIKQAFRKLSLKYHPDKTRNDPILSARFSAIREAYDIIGDQELRGIYDVAGLKMVSEKAKTEKGPEMSGTVHATLEMLYNGHELTTNFARKLICQGCAEQGNTERCRKCTQQCANEVEFRNVRMGPMIMKQQVEVASKQKCRNANSKIFVTIEPGMSGGDTILYKAMGEQQPNKIPGDVRLKIEEKKHSTFKRTGVDLHAEIQISLREALLGFERTLKHLDGRNIVLAYDGVTKPFGVMRINGEGMPYKGDPTQRGTLFVKCKIIMPPDGPQWLRENAQI